MTIRGWLYIIAFLAFLAFIFRPAVDAFEPFDSEAFGRAFLETFRLGRAFGIEAPGTGLPYVEQR